MNKNEELTREQTDRQDNVDNTIFAMVCDVDPMPEWVRLNSGKPIEWDIDIISRIRGVVQNYFVEERKECTEMGFYPYLEESEDIEVVDNSVALTNAAINCKVWKHPTKQICDNCSAGGFSFLECGSFPGSDSSCKWRITK